MFHTIVTHVFNPAWNADHRSAILGVIVVVLFLSGAGLPLPEDLPLSATGFTTFKQSGDMFVWWKFVLAFSMVVAPILLGDLIAYSLGKRYGFGLRNRARFLARALSDRRIARVQRWFDEYGSFTVFLGRQVAGVRFVTFFTAGTMHMKLAKFVLWDFMGCFVSVPVWLTLGALAARYGRHWLHAASRTVGTSFLLGVAVAALILIVVAKIRASRAAQHRTPVS